MSGQGRFTEEEAESNVTMLISPTILIKPHQNTETTAASSAQRSSSLLQQQPLHQSRHQESTNNTTTTTPTPAAAAASSLTSSLTIPQKSDIGAGTSSSKIIIASASATTMTSVAPNTTMTMTNGMDEKKCCNNKNNNKNIQAENNNGSHNTVAAAASTMMNDKSSSSSSTTTVVPLATTEVRDKANKNNEAPDSNETIITGASGETSGTHTDSTNFAPTTNCAAAACNDAAAAAAPMTTATTTTTTSPIIIEPATMKRYKNEAENDDNDSSVIITNVKKRDTIMNGESSCPADETENGKEAATAAIPSNQGETSQVEAATAATNVMNGETMNVGECTTAAATTSSRNERNSNSNSPDGGTENGNDAAAAAATSDTATEQPPVIKLRRSTRTIKHSRIGASYQAAELPSAAAGSLLVLPSPSEHRIKHNLILSSSKSSSTRTREDISSRHGEVLWDPVKAQQALAKMGDDVDALDDFVKKAKELSVRTMLMASLHNSDYNPDIAMHEFKRAVAATPGRGKDLTVHVSDIERLELAEIFEDQTSTFKDFYAISKSTGYSMQKVLVQYYQWKGRRQKDYIMCKGRRKDSDWCDICNDGGTLILCDLCKKGFHLKCLNPPLTRMPKGDWYCRNCLLKSPARIRHSSDGRSCKQITSSNNTVARSQQQQQQQQQGLSKTDWPLSIMDSDKHDQKVSANKGSSNNRQPKQSVAVWSRATTTTTAVATSSSTKPNASNHRAKQQFRDNKQLVAAALAEIPGSLSTTKGGKDAVENKSSKKRKSRHPALLPTEPLAADDDEPGKPPAVANVGTSDQPIALLDDSSDDEDNGAEDNRPAKRSKPSSAVAIAATGTAKQNGERGQKQKTGNSSRKNDSSNPAVAAASVGEEKKNKDIRKLEKAANKAKRKRKKEEKDLYTVVVPVTEEGLLIKIANVKIGVIFTGYRRFQNGDVGPVEANKLFKERGDLIVSVDGIWIVDKTWEETQRILTQHNGRRERTFVVKKGAGKDYFEDTSPTSKRQPPPP